MQSSKTKFPALNKHLLHLDVDIMVFIINLHIMIQSARIPIASGHAIHQAVDPTKQHRDDVAAHTHSDSGIEEPTRPQIRPPVELLHQS